MKRAFALLIVASLSFQALAQGTAMDFIRANWGTVSFGTAGADYASFSSGTAFSAVGNPAKLPLSSQKLDAAGTFGLLPSGESRSMVYGGGASVKLGRIGISAAYLGISHPEIQLSSAGGGASGRFSPNDMMVGLGLAVGIGDYLSLGAVGRYAGSALDAKTKLSSLSADVVAMFRKDALSISAGVVALGPKVESVSNRSYSLPSSARLGAAYVLSFGDFALDIMADADYYFSENLCIAAGIQAGYKDMVFLRTGMNVTTINDDFIATPVPSVIATGAGVKLFGVKLDLGVTLNALTGSALMASLGYAF
ncbi:MAG: hypothetical protein IKZ51_07030 [Bacteroidales bacterium]|nr:hypothetical protein [Bacteroidales bacterium]